jgi:hypothetical protein
MAGRRRPAGVAWVITYPLYAVFAAMLFLSAHEVERPAEPAVRTVIDDPEWEAKLPGRIESLQAALRDASLSLSEPREQQQGAGRMRWTHRFYEISVQKEERQQAEAKLAALQVVDPGVVLTSRSFFNGTEVLVGLDGLLTHTLRVYWSEDRTRPRVGMLVGALGDDLRLARELIGINAPLSLAVLPFRPFSAQVAELGRLFERDVFLHWDALRTPRGELAAAFASVPEAVGVVLPSGLASEQRAEIGAAIEARGLMSVAIGSSGSDEQAAGPWVVSLPLSGKRFEKVGSELVDEAQKSGEAIAVTEADGEVLVGVRAALGLWRDQQLDLVPVSELLH